MLTLDVRASTMSVCIFCGDQFETRSLNQPHAVLVATCIAQHPPQFLTSVAEREGKSCLCIGSWLKWPRSAASENQKRSQLNISHTIGPLRE
ncbi:unnamed protein product [Toxocara canis]|uniref:Secreted protein n=1 Tax=Toxocara canis TaxID=6265 RepID=A0A183ULM1_TOXCA|nr:unnamed protein product [Toxocara canis]